MTGEPMDDYEFDRDDESSKIKWLDFLHTVARHWRFLTISPLLVGLVALGLAFLVPPIYTTNTKFLPPQQQQSSALSALQNLGPLGGLAGVASGIKNPADQYVAFLKSRSVRDALVDQFKLEARYKTELREDALSELDKNARISSAKDGLVTIEVDDTEPAFAAQLANAHVSQLSKLLGRLALTEAQQRRQFFEKQLLQTKDRLVQAEQALKKTGLSASALKVSPGASVTALAQLQAQITAQEVKLAGMRGYLTESSPLFKQAQNELFALRSEAGKFAAPSQGLQDGDADYIARYRDFKYQETLFELYAKQFELAKLDESREGAVIQVVDVAQPPERKSKPKKGLIAIFATLASSAVFLAFVLLRQALRNKLQDPEVADKLAEIRSAWR